jgi:hypothetical protein
MREKGTDKRKSEEQDVLGICYQAISENFLKKALPSLPQYMSQDQLERYIKINLKDGIEIEPSEISEIIFKNGNSLKDKMESVVYDYYLLEIDY